MSKAIDVHVRCFPVPADLRATGIRCFAQIVLEENLFVDGLTVRVSRQGEALVTWPDRGAGRGKRQAVVRMFDPEIRGAVEQAVLDKAVQGGWLEAARSRSDGTAAS